MMITVPDVSRECTEDEVIDDEPLDTNFLISIGAWPPEEEELIEEVVDNDFVEYGPLIDASELTALLHERLEKLHILTETEIEKLANPKFKIINDIQIIVNLSDTSKIYKFGAINGDVLNLIPEEEIDVVIHFHYIWKWLGSLFFTIKKPMQSLFVKRSFITLNL